jgi:hypothetical protein
MFDTLDYHQIGQLLDQFPVPMFALAYRRRSDRFDLICANAALRAALRVGAGEALTELPFLQDDSAGAACRAAIDTGESRRFHAQSGQTGHSLHWDVMVQPSQGADGRIRLIGTAVDLATGQRPNDLVLDDLNYLSSLADLQIENLITVCNMFGTGGLPTGHSDFRLAKLSGICRSVQQAVAEIKHTVREAQTLSQQSSAPAAHPLAESHTIKALGQLD